MLLHESGGINAAGWWVNLVSQKKNIYGISGQWAEFLHLKNKITFFTINKNVFFICSTRNQSILQPNFLIIIITRINKHLYFCKMHWQRRFLHLMYYTLYFKPSEQELRLEKWHKNVQIFFCDWIWEGNGVVQHCFGRYASNSHPSTAPSVTWIIKTHGEYEVHVGHVTHNKLVICLKLGCTFFFFFALVAAGHADVKR